MYKVAKLDKTKLDYTNDLNSPKNRAICDSMELMFQDIVEIASNKMFELEPNQIETFKEMVANTLYYDYVVLFSPINTDGTEH